MEPFLFAMIKFLSKLFQRFTSNFNSKPKPEVITEYELYNSTTNLELPRFTVSIEIDNRPKPEDPQEKRRFKEAFEQITHDIKFINIDKDDVYELLWTHRIGGFYQLGKALKTRDILMNWSWFDEWLERFQNISIYPYMWNSWLVKGKLYPTDLDEATKKLTVKNMKDILRRKGYQEYPKLRAELEVFFKQNIAYEDLQPELRDRMIEKGWKENDEYQELKIELLCHSVIMRSYALRDFERYTPEYLSFLDDKFIKKPKLSFVGDDEEERIVQSFIISPIKNNQVIQIPPFFPGGRANIRYFYRENHNV
ncbi:hypothetical protein [Haemophilus influenzae]|uniref:hypothetical protein n=1 Tax=Haemophilus influenzae TaxID=727 RepID=UPI001EF88FD5|nr:hypothetical protein [Haemophilus influenzae]